MYVFRVIFYRLSLLPLPVGPGGALKQFLSKLLRGGQRPMVHRQVCHQRLCYGCLEMPDLGRLAFLDRSLTRDMMRQKVKKGFPRQKSNPKAESYRRPRGEALFFVECHKAFRNLPGSSNLSRSRKELYRELVVGTASDPLEE